MESESPLPSDIDTDELGERYIFVPHGVKYENENPLIIATIVYDRENEELIGYRYSANYGWKRLSEVQIDDEDILSAFNLEQLFKSVIGYTGPKWNSVHALVLHLDSSFDQSLLEETELQLVSQSADTSKDHTNCETDTESHLFYEQGDVSIELDICNTCGKLTQISVEENGTLIEQITEPDEYNSLENIDVPPERITEVASDDQKFFITDQQTTPNKFIRKSIPFWWNSQLQTSLAQQYVPTQMNTTLCCQDEEIVGTIIWSFVLDEPTILHYHFIESLQDEEQNEYLQSFTENLTGTPYIAVPYHTIPDMLTPLYLLTGSMTFRPDTE